MFLIIINFDLLEQNERTQTNLWTGGNIENMENQEREWSKPWEQTVVVFLVWVGDFLQGGEDFLVGRTVLDGVGDHDGNRIPR